MAQNLTVSPLENVEELPIPPTDSTDKEEAQIRTAFVKYYYQRHFEAGPLDPARFLDQVMTDYATYQGDVVGKWIDNMSPLYKAYRAGIQYVIQYGSLEKKGEAAQYQGVLINNVHLERSLMED
jgi:hypothetical protein